MVSGSELASQSSVHVIVHRDCELALYSLISLHDSRPGHGAVLLLLYHPCWHAPPSEQGGAVQRSSRPQQVCPAGRAVCPLRTNGADDNLSSDERTQKLFVLRRCP